MKISNSQILSLQKCERRFYYEHVLKLRPIEYPAPMELGIAGHAEMEVFFKTMATGATYDECVEALNPLLMSGDMNLLSAYRHVLAFGAYAFDLWEPVHVEESFFVPTGNNTFVFTPDLIARWKMGIHRGQLLLLDFKFTGQYWNDRELGMYQQIPKYVSYYKKHTGETIRHGGVVMLNTRAAQGATGSKLFLIKWVKLTKKKLARIEYENERLLIEVEKAKALYEPEFLRTVDSHQCKMCFFAEDLCPMELEGADTSRVLKRSYQKNTYFEENYGEADSGQ